MKSKITFFFLLFVQSILYCQENNHQALSDAVKDGIIAANKIINPEKGKSQINKIKPDTITDPKKFTLKNMNLIKVEVKDYYFVVSYYDPNIPNKPQLYYTAAVPGEKININTGTTFLHPYFSIVTVPIKIRPSTGSTPSYSRADISNLGIYIGWGKEYDNYFYDNSSTTHKWSAGFVFGPSVEELNPENTNNTITKSSQCYFSSGLMATYTYNKITLAIIPLGVDTGFTSTSKKWIYNGNIWFGLGLGIDGSLLGF